MTPDASMERTLVLLSRRLYGRFIHTRVKTSWSKKHSYDDTRQARTIRRGFRFNVTTYCRAAKPPIPNAIIIDLLYPLI